MPITCVQLFFLTKLCGIFQCNMGVNIVRGYIVSQVLHLCDYDVRSIFERV